MEGLFVVRVAIDEIGCRVQERCSAVQCSAMQYIQWVWIVSSSLELDTEACDINRALDVVQCTIDTVQ